MYSFNMYLLSTDCEWALWGIQRQIKYTYFFPTRIYFSLEIYSLEVKNILVLGRSEFETWPCDIPDSDLGLLIPTKTKFPPI